ncbi:MAG: phosphatase PAP2 family protein [Planctomycetia bacterium]|nr:phosphatase PAP2 family protein [Planctomycetia bacterium]
MPPNRAPPPETAPAPGAGSALGAAGALAALAVLALAAPGRAAEPIAAIRAGIPASREAASAGPPHDGGMFLPSDDARVLWRQTLATVAADWPVIRAVEPDFDAVPPRDGLIESAWVEPPADPLRPGGPPSVAGSWPPRRQRVVVRVAPAPDGAWIDALVETQSIAAAHAAAGPGRVELAGGWTTDDAGGGRDVTALLAARMAPGADPVYALPPLEGADVFAASREPPWARSRYPRLSRAGHKVLEDYRNFYSCESLVCLTAAFGAGALMANTGFDTTMQSAWQQSVVPTDLGTFFTNCKPIGEGKYALPIFGAAAVTGLVFEGRPAGDVVGEWGSRTLRMFVVGAPPVYVLQLATGASRPSDDSSAGSQWKPFTDDNGVSGHAFVGAIPFIAAADMVENPVAKGALYVCSTFVGFSRMTTNSHFPSQVFLGWYLALASSRAVSATETHFAGMEVRVVPLPIADLGGMAVETRW